MSAQRRVLIGGVLVFALALFAVLFLLPHAADDSLGISADATRAPAPAELLPAAESRLPAPMGDGTVGPLAEPEALVAEFDLLAFSERGAAVPGASVQFELGSAQLEAARWPAVGHVVVNSDEVNLAVTAPGWQTARRSVSAQEIRDTGTDELRIVLSPQDVKWGRVLNTRGEPRGGELIRLAFAVGEDCKTLADAEGWLPYPASSSDCRIAQVLGTIEPQPPKPRFLSRVQSIAILTQEPLVLEVRDKPGVWLLLQPDSLMGRSSYAVQHLDPQQVANMLAAFSTTDGVFLPLEADGLHRLRVGTSGWASEWLTVSMQGGIATPERVVVPMSPRPPLRGHVVDPAGAPVKEAWVAVDHWAAGQSLEGMGPHWPVKHRTGGLKEHEWSLTNEHYDRYLGVPRPPTGLGIVQTDVSGSFEVPFQLGIVVIHHPAFAAVTFDVGELPSAPVVLSEGNILEGEVVGQNALQPSVFPLSIWVQGPGFPGPFGPSIVQITTVAADGRFRLTALRQGPNTLTAKSASGERLARVKVEIQPDAVTTASVPVVQPNRVNILIPGSELSVKRVELSSLTAPDKEMRCKPAGEVWSASLDWSGLTSVQVFMGGPGVEAGPIDVVPGQTEYTARLPDATVHFTVDLGALVGSYAIDVKRDQTAESAFYRKLDAPAAEMPHVMPGRYHANLICTDGQPAPGVSVAWKSFEIKPRTESLAVELHAATRALQCEVRDASGTPLQHFQVNASRSMSMLSRGVTDPAGLATLILPLDCTVEVYGQSLVMNGLRAKGVAVEPGQTRIELVATMTVPVELKFVEAAGEPYANGQVELEYLDGPSHGFGGRTKVFPDGSTGLIPLCPGRWIAHVVPDRTREIKIGAVGSAGDGQVVVVQLAD